MAKRGRKAGVKFPNGYKKKEVTEESKEVPEEEKKE